MFSYIAASILCLASFYTHYGVKNVPAYEQVQGDWAKKTVAAMSLQEKIGQLFMVATTSSFEQPEEALASMLIKCPYKMDHDHIRFLIKKYHIGGLIFLFKSTPQKQIDCVNEFQGLSKTPLLIGQDCEWGLSMRLYNTIRFPFNMTLGAVQNKKLIYELGCEIGRQCKALGIHINFAPVVDVNNNKGNPVIHNRSFGQDAGMVAYAGTLMMQGLQSQHILACAKHFPGHGDTTVDSHVDLPVIPYTKSRLHSTELVPFKELIKQGACAVMSAHLAIPELESQQHCSATCSRAIVTDLLEKELGFQGLKITDGLGMEALTKYFAPGDIELNAFLAGNDILLCPVDVPKAAAKIERALKAGDISEEELDRRVLKILRAKEWAGCHERVYIDAKEALPKLETAQAQHLKKQLYEQAITVVRTHGSAFDVTKKTNALLQIGGENLSAFTRELGAVNNVYLATTSSEKEVDTLLEQLQAYTTIVIPVFNMNKFITKNFGVTQLTVDVLARLHGAKKQVVVVAFGTPYSVPLFDKAHALIIAYEDDSEAQKVAARVLKGEYAATGILPVSV